MSHIKYLASKAIRPSIMGNPLVGTSTNSISRVTRNSYTIHNENGEPFFLLGSPSCKFANNPRLGEIT